MEISTLCPASSGHVELLEFSWPPDPGVDGQRSCVAYVLMIREGGFLLAVPDPFFSDEDLGIAGSVSEALDLGPYLRLQASPVALSPDGEWVPADSPTPVPALLLDLPETSTMLLSPLEREFFEGEHFVAGDPALFPLASDVLVQARAWIVSDATGDLASGYHTAEEPGAVPPVNPKRAPKAKRPTVAQLAQQQATLTTIVARLSEQLEQLQQQGAAHAGGFPPTGGAQVARGPMTGAVAPQVAAGQAQGLGAVAAQVATGQAESGPRFRCSCLPGCRRSGPRLRCSRPSGCHRSGARSWGSCRPQFPRSGSGPGGRCITRLCWSGAECRSRLRSECFRSGVGSRFPLARRSGSDPGSALEQPPSAFSERAKVFGVSAGSSSACEGPSAKTRAGDRQGRPAGECYFKRRAARREATRGFSECRLGSEPGPGRLGRTSLPEFRPRAGPTDHHGQPRIAVSSKASGGVGSDVGLFRSKGERTSCSQDGPSRGGPSGAGLAKPVLREVRRFRDPERYGPHQVARAFDLLSADRPQASADALGLLLVYLDQLCLDSGSTTVAWLMTLLPDPPQAIFTNRPPLPGGSLQPFSQLADQTWVTSALGYVREMDLITTRRAEAKTKAPAKKPTLVVPPTETDDPAMTRKQQRAAQWAARKAAAAANPK